MAQWRGRCANAERSLRSRVKFGWRSQNWALSGQPNKWGQSASVSDTVHLLHILSLISRPFNSLKFKMRYIQESIKSAPALLKKIILHLTDSCILNKVRTPAGFGGTCRRSWWAFVSNLHVHVCNPCAVHVRLLGNEGSFHSSHLCGCIQVHLGSQARRRVRTHGSSCN